MSKSTSSAEKETAFALAALMEIPVQYKAAREFGLLGRVTGKAKKIVPRPPPVPYTPPASHNSHSGLSRQFSNNSASAQDDQTQVCPVCLTNAKNTAFNCGHLTCSECSSRLFECPICRKRITSRLRLYS